MLCAAEPAALSGWTPAAILQVKRIGGVYPSPDGKRVAYTVREAVMDDTRSEYVSQIHLVDADGGNHVQLTRGTHSSDNPQWSPDGKSIAFTANRTGKTNLFLIPVSGGEAEQITDVKTGVAPFLWSPDGKSIAFTMVDPPTLQEETATRIKADARVVEDNIKMNRLYVLPVEKDANGKRNPRLLTTGNYTLSSGISDGVPFDWSPDGKTIVFSHAKTPGVNDWPTADISLVDVESAKVRPLVDSGAAELSPKFSPDGKLIAYIRTDDPPTWGTNSTIHVIPAEGGPSRELAETPDRRPTLFGWLHDGKRLLIGEVNRTRSQVSILTLDGPPELIGSNAGAASAGLHLSRDGMTVGFAWETSSTPPEAYVARLDKFAPTVISHVNEEAGKLPVAKTETVRWKSADGREIEGLLTYPTKYEAGKRYPLLLVIHGGPAGVFTESFLAAPSPYPLAIFADRGYATLRVNPRGSSGYGKEFRYANYKDWGGGDFQDLMTGVDHVIKQGVADPERLGVMGWSYGGFMTSWVITHTKRFKAASVGAGVTNLVSFTGTADIPGFLPDYFGGELWHNDQIYRDHSAMFHVKGVTTPTLIQHGANDERVPISQGYELYHALKRQGCTVKMVVYPRTPHGIQEPRLQMDAMSRNLYWFDKYVRGAEPSVALQAPKTRTGNVKDVVHGVEIADPYRWLEDAKTPETRQWIEEQQKYAEKVLSPLPGRDVVQKRLAELMKTDNMTTPSLHGGRYFFSKRSAEQDMPVFYVRNGWDGKDEILLDSNTLSKDKSLSAASLDVSIDGKLWIYGIRHGGEDEVTVKIRDVDAKRDLEFQMPRARYAGVHLTADGKRIYFSRFNKDGPRVYVRSMEPNAAETEIFGKEYGPGKIISTAISEDGKYLLLTVHHGAAADKTEIYVKDLSSEGPIAPIVNDITARFDGHFGGDTLFLLTNWKAPNNRVLAVDLKNPGRDLWKEVVSEEKNVLQSVAPIGGNLYATYLENAATRLKKIRLLDPIKDRGSPEAPEAKDGIGSMRISGRWDNPDFFWTYTSFVQPPLISYMRRTGTDGHENGVWWKSNLPVHTDDFMVKQVRYKSKDGTEIPMFLVHRKDLKLDGENPVFLTGYGGFNISRTPAFGAAIALWVEQGGVYALPSLRGGGEFGEPWHKAGMLEKKQNVFDDFIGAAEWLIANKYTNPRKLAIAGGSNGGLLVGAALTQRPELFQAVVCSVPLLDMVRYHKFLVARFWVPEYGSAENPEQFPFIHAYSPYQHVKPGTNYPAVMFVTGDADTRVDPLHARKMCALLQTATGSDTSEKPIVLHYDTKAGHSAGKPVSKQVEDLADEYAFLFWQLGIKAK
jgi:prolyl oligopeptidase